ncbi:MAG TPA: cation diffusion facilitator family transporter [Spongiibacteraceae bacterium]|nr:cation diffusion facilitator family transporter [Spongiibacteraceae bacterium]
MSGAHDHGASQANEKLLAIALALTASYLIVEVVGGLLTHSLALLSDAAHMMTDVVGLAIALVAIRIARRPADRKRTFGYYRFEILAAAFNAVALIVVAAYILWEAVQRFLAPPEIQSIGMLAVAGIGLVVNIISISLLQSGSDHSLNVKGAYLEVWSDLIGSIGVIAAALIIRLTGWAWVDAVVAVAIGLWVLPRTWLLLRESLHILLEGVPKGIELDDIEQSLLSLAGIAAIHDLHVWALTSGNSSLTAHIVLQAPGTEQEVLARAQALLNDKFAIHHTTLQIEDTACSQLAIHDHRAAGERHSDHDHQHDHGHSH